ncbi:hypothetical protein GCM10009696_29860 [Kocuria himachalensis]
MTRCALGAIAYNELILLYVVLFSAALYAFVLVFAAFFRQDAARLFPIGTRRRGPAAPMFASTVVLVEVWGPAGGGRALRGDPGGAGPVLHRVHRGPGSGGDHPGHRPGRGADPAP